MQAGANASIKDKPHFYGFNFEIYFDIWSCCCFLMEYMHVVDRHVAGSVEAILPIVGNVERSSFSPTFCVLRQVSWSRYKTNLNQDSKHSM